MIVPLWVEGNCEAEKQMNEMGVEEWAERNVNIMVI